MYGPKCNSRQGFGDSRLHRRRKAESLCVRSPNVHIAQAKKFGIRQLRSFGACFFLFTTIAMVEEARAQAAQPTATPTLRDTWLADLPGGKFRVKLSFITSVSIHEYLVDSTARVIEVNVGTMGSEYVRFYAIEPNIPDAPGGIGQSTVNFIKEKTEEVADRLDADAWRKVVKNYPTTTHAHTVEFRLASKGQVVQLFDHVEHAWLYQQPGTFKP